MDNIKKYESMQEIGKTFDGKEITPDIQYALIKAWEKIHGYSGWSEYDNIMVSISGGSDSDIMLDMIERVGYPLSKVHYVFFDTGLEFQATKNHLEYLENKYGIFIERIGAKVPVPLGTKKFGLPFLSKQISCWIMRLQKYDFKFEDRSFSELYEEYPNCKSALKWWCNSWGDKSRFNISYNKWLKEFLIENPPVFKISNKCCDLAKKDTAHIVENKINPNLNVIGIRKSEGGARSSAYKSCFDEIKSGCSQYRPIFWFKNKDKEVYEYVFNVEHSDCYKVYGLKRTGCACCPFGKNFEEELLVAKKYEPKLFIAANNVFGPSYEYTRKYREFCKKKDDELKKKKENNKRMNQPQITIENF